MALDPITLDGQPNPTGLWERIQILTWLYYNQTNYLTPFLSTKGGFQNFQVVVGPPSYAATYATFVVSNTLNIAILGTQTVSQMLGHIAGAYTPQIVSTGGFVNSWFYNTALLMTQAILPIIADIKDICSIEIYGHSYGAGVAGLLALTLCGLMPSLQINVATYGSPRARGGIWIGPTPASWVRCRAVSDIVPTLPPIGLTPTAPILSGLSPWALGLPVPWIHDGTGYLLSPAAAPSTDFSDLGQDIATWTSPSQDWVASHAPQWYAHLLAIAPGSSDPTGTLSTPAIPLDQPYPTGVITPPSGPLTPGLFEDVNAVYYGGTGQPVTAATLPTLQLSAAFAGPPISGAPSNMGILPQGGIMSSQPSGYTKVTLCINNGVYGHQESHIGFFNFNSTQALATVAALCTRRAGLLGNGFPTGQTPSKALSTPQIEFVKLTDAVNPKLGILVDVRGQNYFGPQSSGGSPADTFFNALTVRLISQQIRYPLYPTLSVVANLENSTLQFIGNPDDAIQSGVYIPNYPMGAGTTHLQQMSTYLGYIALTAPSGWGLMGLSSAEPKNAIQSVSLVNGAYQFVVPGAFNQTNPLLNYNNLDRVTLTNANPVFNSIWTINVNAGIITLVNQPVTGHTLPTGGYMQRVAIAGGNSAKAFYQYASVQMTNLNEPIVKVSKKNPGRQFLAVSFRSKRRRQR